MCSHPSTIQQLLDSECIKKLNNPSSALIVVVVKKKIAPYDCE